VTKSKAKVVLGMSGGVDSSVAVHLLQQQGYQVIGVHMKQFDSEESADDAKAVAEKFGIPCHIIDYKKEFIERVFNKTKQDMENGLTPNPCCFCNRDVKFKLLCDMADKLGADYISTGHYVRTKKCTQQGRGFLGQVQLLRGIEPLKDQSYFLAGITREQLSRAIFPLGELTKPQVREIAKSIGLHVHNKPDSLDICFPLPYNNYTIGQRVLEGGQKQRMYYLDKDTSCAYDDPRLYSKSLVAKNFNWLCHPVTHCTAKTRGKQPDQECTIEILQCVDMPTDTHAQTTISPFCKGSTREAGEGFSDCRIRVTFTNPQRAITPGQWCVLYDGEKCLGGGEIVG